MSEEQLAGFRQLPAWEQRLAAAHTLSRELRSVAGYRFEPAAFADAVVIGSRVIEVLEQGDPAEATARVRSLLEPIRAAMDGTAPRNDNPRP